MKIKDLFIKNKEIFQLIYGVFSIILIIVLITLNAWFIISRYNKSIELSLQQMAMNTGRTMEVLLKEDLDNKEKLQNKIETLIKRESDFKKIEILAPRQENFNIIASSKKENLGKTINFPLYNIAWASEGVASRFQLYAREENGQKLVDDDRNSSWLVAIPITGKTGEKEFLLTMKISSAKIDEYTKNNYFSSLIFLIFVLLAVILFLSVAVRLWDYALLYKKIKELDSMKDDFISMASHELRAPVTGIKGYVAMMLDGSFGQINDKLKNVLNIIKGSTERLALLVEDLLNVSRIEQGRIKIESRPQKIDPIITEIIAEMRGQAEDKGLSLIYTPDRKELLINIDRDRFKQILINLISNAIKYTEHGEIKIFAKEKDGNMEIGVKDTGIGMSAEERARLFEKFYRVKNEKTKDVTGTGLGLWITKQLIEKMSGKISVDSIKGTGTQVAIQFPIAKKTKF